MATTKSAIPSDRVAIYDRLINAHPTIQRKGAANPYTSHNGHMFSCMNKAGEIGVRLSKEEQAKFFEEHDSGPLISYGATMRGYVVVPDAILSDEVLFHHYLDRAFAYVDSLPRKPTTRRKK